MWENYPFPTSDSDITAISRTQWPHYIRFFEHSGKIIEIFRTDSCQIIEIFWNPERQHSVMRFCVRKPGCIWRNDFQSLVQVCNHSIANKSVALAEIQFDLYENNSVLKLPIGIVHERSPRWIGDAEMRFRALTIFLCGIFFPGSMSLIWEHGLEI